MDNTKENNQPIVLNFTQESYEVPEPMETVGKDYVSYGADNQFPQDILNMVDECSLLQTLIQTTCDYVYGDGVTGVDPEAIVNDKDETMEEVIKKVIYNYVTFGATSIQVLRNPYGEIKKLVALNTENIRLNEEEDKVLYSSKWKKYGGKYATYEKFDPNNKQQKNSILYYKAVNSRNFYGKPSWISALKDVSILIGITDFNISSLSNGFCVSTMITLPGGIPTQDEQKKVEKNLNDKFSSAKNASKMLLCFCDGKDNAPIVDNLSYDSYTEQYQELQKTSQNNLMGAFRLSETLCGMRMPDTSLFTKENYTQSFDLYNKTVVKPIQKVIKQIFKKMGFMIDFLPFTIEWSDLPEEENTNTEGVLNNEKNTLPE